MRNVTDADSRRAAEYTELFGFFDQPDGSAVEAFDHAVVRAYRWPASELQGVLEANGFDVIETHRRTGPGHRPLGAVVCRRALAPA